MNLNHAIDYLIARFVFIENGNFENLNSNDLYAKILKKERNIILLYDQDSKGNKYKDGVMIKSKEVKK